jgi:Domain of unknown function (DUF4349)
MTTLEQELEIALRAETPRPRAEFAERLDERVAEGFPRTRRMVLPRKRLLPALAVAASLLVVLVVVVSLSGGGSDESTTASSGGEAAVATPSAPKAAADSGTAGGSATPQAQIEPANPLPAVRHVERSAALTLAAPGSKLDEVANQIVSVVDRRHGFVVHSTVTTGSGGATGGEFELRVPSGSLQDTLSDLSDLADVHSRTQNVDDITQPYNAVAAQLSEARALRHSLLARLAKATTDSEANALRRRIRLVSAQIRALSARFADLRNRARFATIDVTLVRERAHHSAAAGGVSGDFHDALHSLAVSFGIALRVLGVALPLALLAALGWLGAAALKRRRREAALF